MEGCQITVSGLLGVPVLLCGALAVVLVGALGAGPLAESAVDGLVVGGSEFGGSDVGGT